jgi:outer membrane immunogenic protein
MRTTARSILLIAFLALPLVSQPARAQQANAQQSNNAYDWNGFYGGGNLGGAFGGSDFLSTLPSGVPFVEGQNYPTAPASPGVVEAYSSNDADVRSFTGGIQTGYNVWNGTLLYGVEVDINLLDAQGSTTTSAIGLADPRFGRSLYTFRNEIDADYIFSARPRVGVTVGDMLIYATGGVAVTTLKYEHSFTATGGFFNGISESASASETKVGWTAGGGFELPIAPNMTLKTEYLFTDFGSVSSSGNKISPLGGFGDVPAIGDFACGADTGQAVAIFGAGAAGLPTPRQCFDHKADLLLHSIRLGLNFKF